MLPSSVGWRATEASGIVVGFPVVSSFVAEDLRYLGAWDHLECLLDPVCAQMGLQFDVAVASAFIPDFDVLSDFRLPSGYAGLIIEIGGCFMSEVHSRRLVDGVLEPGIYQSKDIYDGWIGAEFDFLTVGETVAVCVWVCGVES